MRAFFAMPVLKAFTYCLIIAVISVCMAQDKSERLVIEGERGEAITPEELAVLFSYLDNQLAPYISHIELIDLKTYQACLEENLTDCEQAKQLGIYRLPLHRDEEANAAKEAVDEAWKTFYEAVVRKVHDKINAFPPPWYLLAPCGSHINWAEVFKRRAEGVIQAFAEDQPIYWQGVLTALLENVPLSLWWEGPLPLQQGAVLTAITSLEPQPDQIPALFKEPRDALYHLQPLTAGTPLPYTPDELALPLYPGLEAKEVVKGGNVPTDSREDADEGLEPATVLEQSQFGYGNFFATWGGFENTWFYKWQGLLFTPSIVASVCTIPEPPFIVIIPYIPVPTFVPQVPRAFYGEVSVPEGYAVPRLEGEPLWALPDLDAALPDVPKSLPEQVITGVEDYPEAIPCLPEGATWPPPGYDDLGPPPETTCPEGTPLPPPYDPGNGGQ